MRFDENADGTEVEIPAGGEFDISLPEARTAGYSWAIKNSGEPACTLLSETSEPAPGKVGGSGAHSWHFRAVAPGNCSIALQYRRSWENPEPARTFELKVRVRP